MAKARWASLLPSFSPPLSWAIVLPCCLFPFCYFTPVSFLLLHSLLYLSHSLPTVSLSHPFCCFCSSSLPHAIPYGHWLLISHFCDSERSAWYLFCHCWLTKILPVLSLAKCWVSPSGREVYNFRTWCLLYLPHWHVSISENKMCACVIVRPHVVIVVSDTTLFSRIWCVCALYVSKLL